MLTKWLVKLFDTPLVVRSQVSVMNLPLLSISGVRQLPVAVILSASNNAHYSPMPAQHHAQDVMRAMKAIAGLYELPTPAILVVIPRQNRVAIDLTPTNCTRQRSTGNRRRLYTYVGIG